MRPFAHFSTGVIFGSIFLQLEIFDELDHFIFFLYATILLDLDFLITKIVNVSNHRYLPSHNLILWIFIGIISNLLQLPLLFVFALGAVIHLIIDLIDFGLPVIPGVNWQTPHLIQVDETFVTEHDYARSYWTNQVVVITEFSLHIIALSLIIIQSWYELWQIVIVGVMSVSYSLFDSRVICQN